MKLLLARHGETAWNAQGRIQGCSDTVLNERGRLQAEELGKGIEAGEKRIDICYASPLRRAFETAEIVCRRLELVPIAVEALREVSFGLWENHTWAEVAAGWPEHYAAYQADRRNVRPPEGESYGELLERVLPALDKISASGTGTALIVCHSAVIKAVLAHRAGAVFNTCQLRKYDIANAAWVALE